jgi:cyclopropane fatty-acyl-phospholipid synthase-like methyltransferase
MTSVASAAGTGGDRQQDDAVRLHRLMTGYLASKALFSAMELGVFDALEKGACSAEKLGEQIGLAARPARTLLLALLGEELVGRDSGQYHNEPIASAFLVSTNPQYMGALATHQGTHFGKLTQLTDSLRDDKPVRTGNNYSGAFGDDKAWARRWAEITRASSLLMAENLAAQARLDSHQHLVDLGCASCAYSIALARANPGLRITAVDQPAVAEVAAEFVEAEGLSGQVQVRPANIFTDTFSDCDVALLSHVIQGFERERSQQLINHIYGWLPSGAELLLHTHLPERAQTPFPFLFGLILQINNTQGGEAHDEELTCQWLREAGFTDIEVSTASPISALIRATK